MDKEKRWVDAEQFEDWIEKQLKDAHEALIKSNFEINYYNSLMKLSKTSLEKINELATTKNNGDL